MAAEPARSLSPLPSPPAPGAATSTPTLQPQASAAPPDGLVSTATADARTKTSAQLPVTPLDLSPNHFKLLYLISLYAITSNSTKQNERWLRHVPLLVLMFEGIVRGKFSFDYAPSSVRLSYKGRTLRRWINISREGTAAINDLWELHLVNGLKLSSDDFQPITAYQVSTRGLAMLQQYLPANLQDEVDSFVYPPTPLEKKPLLVKYDGKKFQLNSGGYCKTSAITESEDVSYVSSPFLPKCLHSDGYYHVDAHSNRHRAHECASGSSNTKTTTSEAVTLSDVYALVGEWVPFGSNQIVALNERIGALDRCQGGILTSIVDAAPTDTQFHVPLGQTQVRILDFDFVRFINFEAESHFPETSGIVQIEHFGMHMNCDGSLIYGMKVEAIMDRRGDDISIDHLSRLLVDVHQDSSLLVNDLLSRYQVSLLEMLYLGDSFHRNKYNCVLAKQMRPQLPAKAYVENPLYANELAQVLGDVYASHDITSEGDVLVVGRAGCLFSGPNIFKYESICTSYVALVCRDMFIKNFFARTFVLDATLKEIRRLIHKVHREPATALQVREKLAVVSKDTILLAETLEYLLDSLEDIQLAPEPAQPSARTTRVAVAIEDARQESNRESDADVEARLLGVLALHQLKAQTTMRCHDSIKLMENTMLQLEQLQMIAEATATNQLEIACQRVNLNTRGLMKGAAHQEKSLLTLQALQYVIAGLFAFDVIDRLTGGTWNIHLPKWADDMLVAPILSYPFLWWAINMVAYGLFFWFLHVASRRLAQRILGWTTLRIEVNRKISLPQLRNMLTHRTIKNSSVLHVGATSGSAIMRFRSLVWKEIDATIWSGVLPTIELCYDDQHSFLLFATLHFDTKESDMREEECSARFHELFTKEKIYVTVSTKVDTGVE
uniref:Uncharacterized protein n=1 Tax=Globisporangium ultimum (strain ATCC 200006 / CBS 805.95 / DAOM BR144) TaxID=431595 RepID=K3WIM0_GLOUD